MRSAHLRHSPDLQVEPSKCFWVNDRARDWQQWLLSLSQGLSSCPFCIPLQERASLIWVLSASYFPKSQEISSFLPSILQSCKSVPQSLPHGAILGHFDQGTGQSSGTSQPIHWRCFVLWATCAPFWFEKPLSFIERTEVKQNLLPFVCLCVVNFNSLPSAPNNANRQIFMECLHRANIFMRTKRIQRWYSMLQKMGKRLSSI